MKTKSWAAALGIGALALASALAHAGEKGGNGGGAWVCYDGNGNIQSAQLLDLVEATRPPLNLNVPRTNEPEPTQLERALVRLAAFDPENAEKMRHVLALLDQPGHRVPVAEGYELVPPIDTHLKILRKERGCSLQGLGDFDDQTETLTYDPEILGAMGPTDRAAFDFHEAYYRVQREGLAHARYSAFTRKMTGAIFSTEGPSLTQPTQGLERAKYLCEAPGQYLFYILPNSDGLSGRIQFAMIDSRWLKDLTYHDYDVSHEPNSEVRAVGTKISKGLLQSEQQIPKSRPWFNEWTTGHNDEHTDEYVDEIQTVSEFEPAYSLVLSIYDVTNYHAGPGDGSHWVFDRPWFHENDSVSVRMSWDSPYQSSTGAVIHCRAF